MEEGRPKNISQLRRDLGSELGITDLTVAVVNICVIIVILCVGCLPTWPRNSKTCNVPRPHLSRPYYPSIINNRGRYKINGLEHLKSHDLEAVPRKLRRNCAQTVTHGKHNK